MPTRSPPPPAVPRARGGRTNAGGGRRHPPRQRSLLRRDLHDRPLGPRCTADLLPGTGFLQLLRGTRSSELADHRLLLLPPVPKAKGLVQHAAPVRPGMIHDVPVDRGDQVRVERRPYLHSPCGACHCVSHVIGRHVRWSLRRVAEPYLPSAARKARSVSALGDAPTAASAARHSAMTLTAAAPLPAATRLRIRRR